jgi:hypothetical protein
MATNRPSPSKLHVRYDLVDTLNEARADFTADMGTRRLLKQSEISTRFRKPGRPAAKPEKK